MRAHRKQDYLFKVPSSQHWRIRLQMDGKSIVRSLGTPDRAQAEIVALPLIAEHKARLLAKRPRLVAGYKLTPGEYTNDGQRVIATERELIYLAADGALLRTEPNVADRLENLPVGAVIHFGNPTRPLAELRRLGPVIDVTALNRPAVATDADKDPDTQVIERYLTHANTTDRFAKEARDVWALFRSLVKKPLAECDREDGAALAAHFESQGLASATVRKKLMWLCAAVNLDMKRKNGLKFNPFSGVVPKRDDKVKRLPLDDADIAATKDNLGKLTEADQVLFRLLATTGMRLSEAFEIGQTIKVKVKVKINGEWTYELREQVNGDATEQGVRYVIVGHKTPQSERRVPLPAGALPYLPKAIKGPLFTGGAPAASKRLNRYLRDIGITDPRKVLHSLRHRAQDRLRAAGCPEDIRWAILGHEEETVAAGYGKGFPVPMLREWIDRIGF
jgi:integrase